MTLQICGCQNQTGVEKHAIVYNIRRAGEKQNLFINLLLNFKEELRNKKENNIFLKFHKEKIIAFYVSYSDRRLVGTRVIEFVIYCNQMLPVLIVYTKVPVNVIIRSPVFSALFINQK